MNIIIMAHGNQERWFVQDPPPFKSKHLILVRKQPLLKRTIDLFAPHGDITVFGWGWYEKYIDYPCTKIHPVKSLLDGILQTRDYWGDRTLFLLGDVLFSRNAVSTLVEKAENDETMFFGRPHPSSVTTKQASELFGFTMVRKDWDQIIEHCKFMTQIPCILPPPVHQKDLKYPPKLWALYRLCCGNECHQNIIDLKLLEVIDDYTDDIDSPEAYDQFWDSMIGAELGDN